MCSRSPAPINWKSPLEPAALDSSVTSLGNRTGFLNCTAISTFAAGKCSLNAAIVRALFHKPWAMAVGKPNSLALTALR